MRADSVHRVARAVVASTYHFGPLEHADSLLAVAAKTNSDGHVSCPPLVNLSIHSRECIQSVRAAARALASDRAQ